MRSRCEQGCGADATVYAMGPKAGDWAGRYCEPCAKALRFQITDRFDKDGNVIPRQQITRERRVWR